MTEAQEQATVIQYCDLRRILVFAIPNGGFRNTAEAAKLKWQGVRPGVPDLFIPVQRGGYGGLFIEMKRADGKPSDITKEQMEWLEQLNDNGYMATVCFGFEDAIRTIDGYLKHFF